MKPTLPHIGLLGRICIAIILGIGVAFVSPMWLSRIFATFSSIFSSLLGFIIPLLIVGFVAPAIADIGRRAGAMLGVTVLIAYIMTFCSGMMSYSVSNAIFPSLIGDTVIPDAAHVADNTPLPYFTITMEPLMTVMSALVLAFLLGFCCAILPDTTKTLRHLLGDFRNVIQLTIGRLIIPLLPVYIFCIFLNMTAAGSVGPVLMTFIKIIAVIFVMHVGLLIAQYCIAAIFSRKNPFSSLRTMLPAYATALGTQSSAAGFVIPLCATIHMSGSTLKIVACAVALMIVHGMPFDTMMFASFIAMLGVTIVAAPGVPGGAIMASLGLLSSVLGFSESDNAMMIALYIAMDSFGTACNITGDGAIAQIVDRIFSRKTASATA